ncbi:MAG: beta-lactamase family protein [Deltaproteobacteria bacterium]|nr:beta-lactamase family protein [Deltaproteobacteria bacterium]
MNILKRTTFVILLAVFFVVTCAKDGRITTMKDLKVGDWTDHGFSEAQKLELKSIMEDAVETGEIAGCSVLLIHRGEVIFKEASGYADIETKRPFRVDDICALASVTKPFTATLLMILEEEGSLSLDDPADDYLPEFKGICLRGKGPSRSVPTIRQLLSHTAGLGSSNDFRSEMVDIISDGTLADVSAFLAGKELITEPGTKYFYTSAGYSIAGRIAEVSSGKEFSELLQQRLLNPIMAHSTTFHPSETVLKNVPRSFARVNGKLKLQGSRFRGACVRPGGGLFATMEDVGKFMMLHRNGGLVNDYRIVSSENLSLMYESQPNTKHGYGLGFNVLKKDSDGRGARIRHLGASGTMCWFDFDLDLIAVFFTQMPQRQIRKFRERLMESVMTIFEEANQSS